MVVQPRCYPSEPNQPCPVERETHSLRVVGVWVALPARISCVWRVATCSERWRSGLSLGRDRRLRNNNGLPSANPVGAVEFDCRLSLVSLGRRRPSHERRFATCEDCVRARCRPAMFASKQSGIVQRVRAIVPGRRGPAAPSTRACIARQGRCPAASGGPLPHHNRQVHAPCTPATIVPIGGSRIIE